MKLFRRTSITVTNPRLLKSLLALVFSAIIFLILFMAGFCLKLLFDALYFGENAVVFFSIHYTFILCTFMYLGGGAKSSIRSNNKKVQKKQRDLFPRSVPKTL